MEISAQIKDSNFNALENPLYRCRHLAYLPNQKSLFIVKLLIISPVIVKATKEGYQLFTILLKYVQHRLILFGIGDEYLGD